MNRIIKNINSISTTLILCIAINRCKIANYIINKHNYQDLKEINPI